MLRDGDTAEVRQICEATLRQNWREGVRETDGVPFAYTCPSPGHYPWQWYWDSCFTAITWRHFDRTRSRRELESLLAAQREDGFIGHTIFWNTPLTGRRRFTYNVTSPNASMTSSIQPPLLAWAWRIAVGDPAAVPGIVRHYDWLSANRDLDGDGLVWIVQPDESGLDASPQFDAMWGRRAHDRPGFIFLVRRNRKLGYDLGRINAAGGPVCAEVAMNVLHGLSLLALKRESLTPTIVERMYDETSGLFAPLVRPEPKRHARAHVGGAGAAGTPGPPGGHRPPARRRPPPRHQAVLAAGAAAVGPPHRAELLAPRRRPPVDPALLARPDVDQRRVARVARAHPPRLRASRRRRSAPGSCPRCSRRDSASTTTRTRGGGWARSTSPGPRS